MNFHNSIHISNVFYVYIMYACMDMGFVPETNFFLSVYGRYTVVTPVYVCIVTPFFSGLHPQPLNLRLCFDYRYC